MKQRITRGKVDTPLIGAGLRGAMGAATVQW
jgi:hypothetical protein